MRHAQRVAGLCLMAAAVSFTAPAFAEERTLLDNIYFNASAVSGRAETSNVTGGGLSIGLSLPKNLFLQGDYQYLDLTEGLDNASVIKGMVGVQHGMNDSISMYIGGGGYYAEEEGDDADSGDGYALTAGMTWGNPKLSALLHVDYLTNTDNNAELYVVGIGVRMQLGGNPQVVRQRQSPGSMDQTTACEERYRELFPFCRDTTIDQSQ